jgi:S-adenosylmethionine decarboxylase proenzyme
MTDIVGVHVMMAIRNIPEPDFLNTIETIKPLLDTVVTECNLHVVAEAGHQFEPFGATYVYVLEESHMSIHTYPEKARVYMDIFCCDPDFDHENALRVVQKLFKTADIDSHVVKR